MSARLSRKHLPAGVMPRMLSVEQAAEYCGSSPATFLATCPIKPKDLGFRGVRWDSRQLDDWLDRLPIRGDAGGEGDDALPPQGSKEQALLNARRRLKRQPESTAVG